MKKSIKVTDGRFTLIRCDRFNCESVFKARSSSMQNNIKEARNQGWVLGKRDHCGKCHKNPFSN